MNQGVDQRHRFSDVAERRKWLRLPSGNVDVWVPPVPVKARVLDESFGGIGLLVKDTVCLEISSKTTLIYNGCPMWATVRHVGQQSETTYHIGLQWAGSQAAELAVGLCESRARQKQQADGPLEELIDPQPNDDTQWFVKEVPAGARKMWDLFEHSLWDDLLRTTNHLKNVAAFLRFDIIAADAEKLNIAVDQQLPKREIQQALETLIETCTRVCLFEQARLLRDKGNGCS